MNDKIITSPSNDAESNGLTSNSSELVISDEQYAQLSETTNAEQLAKLRCWDIKEYIEGIEAQKTQLEITLANANTQLDEAKHNLVQSRTQLKSTFDIIFGPLGLENKMVTVSQSSPHVVTVVDAKAQEQVDISEKQN